VNASHLLDKATCTLEHRIVGDGTPLLLIYDREGIKPAVVALHRFIGKKHEGILDMLPEATVWLAACLGWRLAGRQPGKRSLVVSLGKVPGTCE